MKSNNKSEYNKNILLNYSKGLNLNGSVQYTNFNDNDYNTDLLLKKEYTKHRLEALRDQNNTRFHQIKSMRTVLKRGSNNSKKSRKSTGKKSYRKSQELNGILY